MSMTDEEQMALAMQRSLASTTPDERGPGGDVSINTSSGAPATDTPPNVADTVSSMTSSTARNMDMSSADTQVGRGG